MGHRFDGLFIEGERKKKKHTEQVLYFMNMNIDSRVSIPNTTIIIIVHKLHVA